MNKQYTLAITLLLSCSFGLFACEKSASKTFKKEQGSRSSSPALQRRIRKRHHHGSSGKNTIVTYVKAGSACRYQISDQKPTGRVLTQEEIQQKHMAVLHDTLYGA